MKDFLPFKCDACALVYCLDHRTYASHSCPAALSRDHRTEICALCGDSISFFGVEDKLASAALHAHIESGGCRGAKLARESKLRCPAPGCRSRLALSMRVQCHRCHQYTCLQHRFTEDHACSAASRSALIAQPRSEVPQTGVSSEIRGSASSLHEETAPLRIGAASAIDASASYEIQGAELCPSCGASFGTLTQLINHCERFHSSREAISVRS